MQTIQVKASEVRAAVNRAAQVSVEWQAACCEIARIPAVHKRWRELNLNLTGLEVEFHEGLPYTVNDAEQNAGLGRLRLWSCFAGWTLKLFDLPGGVACRYNTVRVDWYGHGPSVCWDGMRRETRCEFIYALLAHLGGYAGYEEALAEAGIVYDSGA